MVIPAKSLLIQHNWIVRRKSRRRDFSDRLDLIEGGMGDLGIWGRGGGDRKGNTARIFYTRETVVTVIAIHLYES
jgi:hypothetical protein